MCPSRGPRALSQTYFRRAVQSTISIRNRVMVAAPDRPHLAVVQRDSEASMSSSCTVGVASPPSAPAAAVCCSQLASVSSLPMEVRALAATMTLSSIAPSSSLTIDFASEASATLCQHRLCPDGTSSGLLAQQQLRHAHSEHLRCTQDNTRATAKGQFPRRFVAPICSPFQADLRCRIFVSRYPLVD